LPHCEPNSSPPAITIDAQFQWQSAIQFLDQRGEIPGTGDGAPLGLEDEIPHRQAGIRRRAAGLDTGDAGSRAARIGI
jgi:hypothetical protein